MHIMIVHAEIKPEFIEAFIAATKINAANSAKEPGIARFEFLQQQDDPGASCSAGIYRDEAAPGKPKGGAHYKVWLETVNDMFVPAPEPSTRISLPTMPPTESFSGQVRVRHRGAHRLRQGAIRGVPAARMPSAPGPFCHRSSPGRAARCGPHWKPPVWRVPFSSQRGPRSTSSAPPLATPT